MVLHDAELLQDLTTALAAADRLRQPASQRNLRLSLLHSASRRTYSLFPWSADISTNKVFIEDLLLVAAELVEGCWLPVYALEAALFSLPASNARLAYVSKVDTTGLSSAPSPAATLTAALLQHLTTACRGSNFRLHVFAKPAKLYLFPGSADNLHKKQLEDKELAKWWMRILAAISADHPIKGHTLIPGLEWPEIRRLLAPMPSNWSVGLPLTPLVDVPSDHKPTLGDLIPCFPDDPKSRYMTSLTSSPLGPAGEKGDYDEQTKALLHNHGGPTQMADFEAQREKERLRLSATENEAFLEGLAWRQECCAGGLVAFFVLAAESLSSAQVKQVTPSKEGLSHSAYVNLWNSFHNANYHASIDKRAEDLQRIAKTFQEWSAKLSEELGADRKATVEVTLEPAPETAPKRKEPDADGEKGTQPPVNVMTLKPRKKVKPAP